MIVWPEMFALPAEYITNITQNQVRSSMAVV
jgi:hypothetical protein